MTPIPALLEKVLTMSSGIDLDSKTDHFYEREVVERVQAREDVSVPEAIDAIVYLRSLIEKGEGHEGNRNAARG